MTRSQCDLKQTMKQTAWSAGNQDYQIAIGFNIATEMVADRTEKGKNQCNFGPLYSPFVKLSQHFIGKNNTLGSIIFVFLSKKLGALIRRQEAWPEKNKTARFTILFLCCILFSLLLRTVIALSRTKDAFAWKILLVLVLKSEGLHYDHFV